MCMPEPAADATAQRAPFRRLRELLADLNRRGHALDTLSMGMSADLEAAIAEGATIVRIGTAIFGPAVLTRTSTMRIAFIGGGQHGDEPDRRLRARGVGGRRDHRRRAGRGARSAALAREYSVRTTADNAAAAHAADTIVLAVKPQDVRDVATGIAAAIADRRRLVVSIAAGIRLADLARWLGADVALVRAMPNRPALIGRGITALYAPPGVNADGAGARGEHPGGLRRHALDRFRAAARRRDGSLRQRSRLFLPADGSARGRRPRPRASGRRRASARDGHRRRAPARWRRQGTARRPELREQVTSKGGTTAAALAVLDAADLRAIFSAAVAAATRRAAELARAGRRAMTATDGYPGPDHAGTDLRPRRPDHLDRDRLSAARAVSAGARRLPQPDRPGGAARHRSAGAAAAQAACGRRAGSTSRPSSRC